MPRPRYGPESLRVAPPSESVPTVDVDLARGRAGPIASDLETVRSTRHAIDNPTANSELLIV